MRHLVIFLVRKWLGLKLMEHFRFSNQKHREDYYFFTRDSLIKMEHYRSYEDGDEFNWRLSGVSLNWLLTQECKSSIEKLDKDEMACLPWTNM